MMKCKIDTNYEQKRKKKHNNRQIEVKNHRGLISITFIFRLFGSGKHCFMGSFTNAKI